MKALRIFRGKRDANRESGNGVLLMVSRTWTNFNMTCSGWLAGLKPMKDPFTKR